MQNNNGSEKDEHKINVDECLEKCTAGLKTIFKNLASRRDCKLSIKYLRLDSSNESLKKLYFDPLPIQKEGTINTINITRQTVWNDFNVKCGINIMFGMDVASGKLNHEDWGKNFLSYTSHLVTDSKLLDGSFKYIILQLCLFGEKISDHSSNPAL